LISWEDKTIWGMLRQIAQQYPDQRAIVFQGQKVTYRELYDRSLSLAANLARWGVKKGDHVGTCLPIGCEWIYLKYALNALGAVIVPINLFFREKEFQFLLSQSDLRYLITVDQYQDNQYLEMVPPVQKNGTGYHRLKDIFVMGSGGTEKGFISFEKLMRHAPHSEKLEIEKSSDTIEPGDVAYLLYTSGSTAFPKGALRSNYSLLGIAYYLMSYSCRIDSSDRILSYLPFYHIGGCIYMVLGSHLAGAELHLLETFDARSALKMIQKEKITFISGFDTHFNRLLSEMQTGSYEVHSAKKVLLATGPDWYDRIRDAGFGSEILVHHYGFTEGTGVAVRPGETDYQIRKYSNGKPFPGVEVRIRHPETGDSLLPNQPGEICLKGWTLFNGYYKMPEETKRVMDADGFFHTGDYGWLDEKGNLYFRGRYKMMVKSGGENVSQREVEIAIEENTDVRNVQVIGLPDPLWGEAVTAIIEMHPGRAGDPQKIIDFCRKRLAKFKVPKKILFVNSEEWPITMTGKIDKFKLKEIALKKLQ
jgi:fatty-acyl-CoA synthase